MFSKAVLSYFVCFIAIFGGSCKHCYWALEGGTSVFLQVYNRHSAVRCICILVSKPHQWCSWNHFVFWVIQPHTPSSRWPSPGWSDPNSWPVGQLLWLHGSLLLNHSLGSVGSGWRTGWESPASTFHWQCLTSLVYLPSNTWCVALIFKSR